MNQMPTRLSTNGKITNLVIVFLALAFLHGCVGTSKQELQPALPDPAVSSVAVPAIACEDAKADKSYQLYLQALKEQKELLEKISTETTASSTASALSSAPAAPQGAHPALGSLNTLIIRTVPVPVENKVASSSQPAKYDQQTGIPWKIPEQSIDEPLEKK